MQCFVHNTVFSCGTSCSTVVLLTACQIARRILSACVFFWNVVTFIFAFSLVTFLNITILDGSQNCEKRLLDSSCLSYCPHGKTRFPLHRCPSKSITEYFLKICRENSSFINPYPTAFPYGNGMVLHFYQQQDSSTTKTVHKVINKGLKTYV